MRRKVNNWKQRALAAEARANTYAEWFKEKTGMEIYEYSVLKQFLALSQSPRDTVIITNVEVPCVS